MPRTTLPRSQGLARTGPERAACNERRPKVGRTIEASARPAPPTIVKGSDPLRYSRNRHLQRLLPPHPIPRPGDARKLIDVISLRHLRRGRIHRRWSRDRTESRSPVRGELDTSPPVVTTYGSWSSRGSVIEGAGSGEDPCGGEPDDHPSQAGAVARFTIRPQGVRTSGPACGASNWFPPDIRSEG